MIAGAVLAFAVAAVLVLLAMSVGAGIGRAAERRRWERRAARTSHELELARQHLAALAVSANAHEAMVHEHGDELRARRHLQPNV